VECAFVPSRARTYLRSPQGGKSAFKAIFGAGRSHAPVEAISVAGMEEYDAGFDRCVQAVGHGNHSAGRFLDKCLRLLGVGVAEEPRFLSIAVGETRACDTVHAAFYPFRNWTSYLGCLCQSGLRSTRCEPLLASIERAVATSTSTTTLARSTTTTSTATSTATDTATGTASTTTTTSSSSMAKTTSASTTTTTDDGEALVFLGHVPRDGEAGGRRSPGTTQRRGVDEDRPALATARPGIDAVVVGVGALACFLANGVLLRCLQAARAPHYVVLPASLAPVSQRSLGDYRVKMPEIGPSAAPSVDMEDFDDAVPLEAGAPDEHFVLAV